nr:hypothetical protein [Tanacetum cinerariifolium]
MSPFEFTFVYLVGVNTPRSDEDRLKLMELMVFLLQKGVCVEIGITVARISSYCCQVWNTASVKRAGDVTRLQALVDKKKIVIFEAVIREILQLDDVEGVVCLPNEEIFAGLAQMGYEKPTSWNKFSTTMASAVICLSKGQRFNFLKYIFDSLVRNVDSSSKFYMYPRFIQLIIQNQVGDFSTHTTRFISPALTQKVFANMRRVGKGFSGVETPLFEGMLVARQPVEEGLVDEQVQVDDVVAAAVEENVAEDVAHDAIPSPPPHEIPSPLQEPSSPPQQPQSSLQAPPQDAELPTQLQQVLNVYSALTKQDDLEVQEVVEDVTTAKLITEVVTAAASQLHEEINRDEFNKDIDWDAAMDRVNQKSNNPQKLHEEINRDEFNKDIDWDAAMDRVNQKSNNPQYIKRYQGMKKRPQTESEARKNMMIYLKNTAGYKMDFFK